MAKVETNTVDRWCETFLAMLTGTGEAAADSRPLVDHQSGSVAIGTEAAQAGAEPNGHRPLTPAGYRTSH